MRRLFCAILFGLVCCPTLKAQDLQPIATVEGVSEYRLSNGARVVLFPEQSRPTITVNMTVLVGSRHEGYGEAGMAHLLEHMVFKGTPTFPDVPKALRDHGANFNGTTNEDRTNYFETLTATDENLEFAIQLESDRLVNSYVKREDLMSEFSVVRNEFERGENSPQQVLSQRISAVAFEWHNYGKTTIGNRSDIERVPIDNLQDFYRKFYQPDNVVLIITGKFDVEKAKALVSKYLGSIPKPERKLSPTYTEEPPQDGERTVILRRVGAIGSVGVAYHIPAGSHPDWAPLSILASVLSEQTVGRLQQALVETKIATSVFARADNSHDPGLFSVSSEPSEGRLEEVRDLVLETMEKMGETPFGEEEINRAKNRAKRSSEQLLSNAAAMSQALSSAAACGDWRLLFIQRDRLAAVTVDDVNRVAKTYFKKHNRTVGMFIPVDEPQRLSVPAVEGFQELVNNYKGGEAISDGEAFDPSPANIDARTKIVEMDGIKIAMLPKKNRGETVNMTITLHFGNESSLKDQSAAASMLASLMSSGTERLDRRALREQLEAIGVRIGAGAGGGGRRGGRGGGGGGRGGNGQVTFSVEAKRESVIQGIQILTEILRSPSFPEDEFEQMKARAISAISETMSDPNALAGNKLSRELSKYSPGDPRYVPTLEENKEILDNLSLDQIREIYKQQLAAGQVEVAVVGDFDPEEVLSAVTAGLKDWKTSVPIEKIASEVKPMEAGLKEDILTPDKANAVFLAGLSFAMNDQDPMSDALQLGNFILGGGTLSSRLGDRIRQKEGLSYGVTSSVSIPTFGNDARFGINAITNPGNIDAVEKAAMEELERFIKDGPTEKELADAKTAYLESLKVSRTADQSIAGQLLSNLELRRNFQYIAEREQRIATLTVDDIKSSFAKYVDPKKLVIVRAGDFKK